jgi:redox-sensitive bicupin YhaK (pirin superfamily)
MIRQSKGKMFMADERGLNETDRFRSYNTFNLGRHQHPHKNPFGALYALNEDTLAGNSSLEWTIEENTDVILIPVVGAIGFKDSNKNTGVVEPGMIQVISLAAGAAWKVNNPYPDQLVKYLQIWVKNPENQPFLSQWSAFDLNSYQLADIFHQCSSVRPGYSVAMAKLAGRQEGAYYIKHPKNGIFFFAIQGALEVQYRLMHEGDGLALWDLEEVEFEALSNDAILLVIEVPLESSHASLQAGTYLPPK